MQYEELKQQALANAAEQRAQLDQRLKERARERASAQSEEERRVQQRSAWLAREKERKAQRERAERARAQERQARAPPKSAYQEREAAARAAGLRPTGRSPAFQKAQQRAQEQSARRSAPRRAPEPRGGAALTRDEKRKQRMAREMGVPYKRTAPKPTEPERPRPGAAQPGPAARAAEPARREEASDEEEDVSEDVSEDGDEDEGPGHASIRDEIWRLFGKQRDKYIARDVDSDQEDMEAGADDVLAEELRSARYGRREDEREEAELAEHKRRKLARKHA